MLCSRKPQFALFGRLVTAIIVMLVFCHATPSLALVNPPDWWAAGDDRTFSACFDFRDNTWPPKPTFASLPSGFNDSAWYAPIKTTTQWVARLAGREGLFRVLPCETGASDFQVRVSSLFRNECPKEVWYQYDAYAVAGEFYVRAEDGSTTPMLRKQEWTEYLPQGWVRVTGVFELYPRPYWDLHQWAFAIRSDSSVFLDGVCVGARCVTVPEPTGILIVCSGLALLLGRRRVR